MTLPLSPIRFSAVSKLRTEALTVRFLLKAQENKEEILFLTSSDSTQRVGLSGPDKDFFEITCMGLDAKQQLGNPLSVHHSYFQLLQQITGAENSQDLTQWYLDASAQKILGLHKQLTRWAKDYAQQHHLSPPPDSPDSPDVDEVFENPVTRTLYEVQHVGQASPDSFQVMNPTKTLQ